MSLFSNASPACLRDWRAGLQWGVGLIATVRVVWLREPLNVFKVLSRMLIIVGVIGLQVSGGVHEP
jgi:hypothetical protein